MSATTGLADSAVGKFDATTPPKDSQLDKSVVGQLLVNLDQQVQDVKDGKEKVDIEGIMTFQRAADYLSCAQIFLRSNALLQRDLTQDDIKRRLLGHWGTCPGLNFVYAHATAMLQELEAAGEQPEWIFVTGPGHGAPAVLASLFLEGTWEHFYPDYPATGKGLEKFVRAFSFPGGFPSHVNAETPGAIHEGGELGYALAVSYGSVMDRPNQITIAVIGDGESETGPTAGAWHAHKYLDPAESGAVIPVLHANGYKIGERTIPGTMDNLELAALYTGYGYQVRIVEYPEYHERHKTDHPDDVTMNLNMAASMRWALREIRKIQSDARSGKPQTKPRWPLIILRSPKGWGGPKSLNGHPIEGSWRAHQVPLPKAATDENEFKLLIEWLKSYKPEELFHPDRDIIFDEKVTRILPKALKSRMGMNQHSNGGFIPLKTPDWRKYLKKQGGMESNMRAIGDYLVDVVRDNPHTFRIFSPDEITSNKLDACMSITHRDFQWDPETAHNGGRITEMLSEHTLQGFLQGYTLTGRHGLFPSYEAFLGIVTTMIEQYTKFIKMALETSWRRPVAGLTYIETSSLWRQEHNGYSHQNPGLICNFITLPRNLARIYFPPDANCSVSTIDHCLRSQNFINLVVGSKNPSYNFLGPEDAEKHCVAGISCWKQYSTDEGMEPDVVLVGIGVEVTFEVIAAANILRNAGVRVRVLNVNDLFVLGHSGGPNDHPHALSEEAFNALFTVDKPVIINFHGYPQSVAGLLFGRPSHVGRARFHISGYEEQGSTTTPWSMLRLNHASRYNIADTAMTALEGYDPDCKASLNGPPLQHEWRHILVQHEKYVNTYGEDPEWCAELPKLNDDAV